jgi:hypothetical protein
MFDQNAVIELLQDGASLRQTLKRTRISRTLFYDTVAKSPVFAERYARAMQTRAHRHAERIEQLADKVEREKIKPDAARVAIDARKWVASKLHPRAYGDKLQLDGDLKMEVTVNDPTLRARAALLPAAVPALVKPIDDESA